MSFSLFCVDGLRGVLRVLACVSLALGGCTTVRERDVKPGATVPGGQVSSHGGQPNAIPPVPSSAGKIHEAPTLPAETKSEVSVGLILGPGGLKTLAQIGVLRELERAQIPIRNVVGLEWGAVIGGLFSSHGRANDVEWQLSKLKATDLPQSGRIFGSEIQPVSLDRVVNFLEQAAAGRKAHEGRIGFSCPFLELSGDFVQWVDQGLLKDALMSCLPFPPVFEARQRSGSPFSIRSAVKWLRNRGAQKIIAVNVLPSGEVMLGQNYAGGQALEFLWREIRNQMRTESDGIDWAIDVSTRGYSFHEIENLRSLVSLGSKVTASQIPSLKKRLGL